MQITSCEQGSIEWKQHRLCKISGTRLADAIGTPLKQEDLINNLIAEFLTGESKEIFASQAMMLGTEAENFCVDEYECYTGEITEVVGLCQSDEFDWLISSPDRLIKNKGKYTKAVEIKSPNPETAIKYIRKNVIPKEYFAQVLCYFLVNEDLKELDFVVYSPKIQTDQYRLWVKNVKRKDIKEDLEKAKEKLIQFHAKWQDALVNLNLSI